MPSEIDLNTIDTSNTEDLLKAFESLESGDQPAPVEAPAPAPAVADAPVNQETETKAPNQAEQSQNEPEPDGVATKDGKHIIPYTVLRSERERANRAEQLLRDAQTQLDALRTSQGTPGSQGAKEGESARTDAMPDVSDLSPEDLEALKEDFPTVYKAVTSAMAAAKAVEAKFKPVEESMRDQERDAARTAQEQVQDAIDATPKLAHLQASDPQGFEMAKQFDAVLRTQPAWANKPLAERFAKVTEMVENAVGAIEIPGAPATRQTAEQLRAAAIAKADASARATRTAVPTSLSEFPAGAAPASDERQAVENMNPLQLAEKFASMSPDQMDAYLSNL